MPWTVRFTEMVPEHLFCLYQPVLNVVVATLSRCGVRTAMAEHMRHCFEVMSASATPLVRSRFPPLGSIERQDVKAGSVYKPPVAETGIPTGAEEMVGCWVPPQDLESLPLIGFRKEVASVVLHQCVSQDGDCLIAVVG